LDSRGSVSGLLAGSGQHGNEVSVFVKDGDYLDNVRDYSLVKGSASWR